MKFSIKHFLGGGVGGTLPPYIIQACCRFSIKKNEEMSKRKIEGGARGRGGVKECVFIIIMRFHGETQTLWREQCT